MWQHWIDYSIFFEKCDLQVEIFFTLKDIVLH